jgi:hypothetical protein
VKPKRLVDIRRSARSKATNKVLIKDHVAHSSYLPLAQDVRLQDRPEFVEPYSEESDYEVLSHNLVRNEDAQVVIEEPTERTMPRAG